MSNYRPEMSQELADKLGTLLRPGQTIGFDKLMAKATESDKALFIGKERVYEGVRELIRRGFVTRKLRRGKPALLTFHNPPLPTPQQPLERKKGAKGANGTSNIHDATRVQRLLNQLRKKEEARAEIDIAIASIKEKLRELLTD